MYITEWIVTTLEFISDVIIIGLLLLAYWFVTTKVEFLKRFKSRNMDQNHKSYTTFAESNGYDNDRYYFSHNDNSNDSDMFSYMNQQNDDSEDNQYGESTGGFILRGGSHEELDYSNPNHYPIIDSYDNNGDDH